MGKRGRKICPKCNKGLGARTLVCACGYNFYSPKKIIKEKEEIKEEIKEEVIKEEIIPYVALKKLTPKQHAERILGYGVERAKILLFLARTRKYWSHVDWDIVEQRI